MLKSSMMCWHRYVLLQQEDDDSARKAAADRREAAEVECEKVCRNKLCSCHACLCQHATVYLPSSDKLKDCASC